MKDYLTKPELLLFLAILLPLLTVAVSFGVTTARLDNLDKRLGIAEARIEVQTDIIQRINISLATIQKDIQYIKAALDLRGD